jgi:Na+-transporting methylmalonyl-CoA/oxaloacetate decarboxylase gamma subunit
MMNPASINLSGAGLVAKLSKDSEAWGDAWRVAGVGFGVVFLVLIVLAVAIWVTGIVVKKMETREKNKEVKEAEEKKA